MISETTEKIKIHRNIPQLLFQLVIAAVNICIWGRATGKTEGPMVDFTIANIFAMPKSNGFLLGTTYEQLLTRTLPPLIAGWEKYGYRENEHFWIRKYAPDKLKIEKAFRHPVDPKHYIQWYNGSGIYLVSQDRPGTINGVRTQWGAGDEARFLNKAKFDDDVIPTMAGHADLFDHLSNYLSLLFCTDMPRTSKGKWLLDYREKMDAEVIQAILDLQAEGVRLQRKFFEAPESVQKKLRPKLKKIYDYVNELRRGSVYFSVASTLDNIHALGIDAIKQFKRVLSDTDFQISILNNEMLKLENGFYALLDEEDHGYNAFDYEYIEGLPWNYRQPSRQDCRWDADVDKHQPLTIACDHNNAINCIATAQEVGDETRLLSTKFVLNPLMLKDAVELWHEYYRHHPERELNYIYDSTSVGGDASSDISFSDEMTTELDHRGWIVNRIDIGQIGSHHSRFFFWGKMLQEMDNRLPKFRFNKSNNKDWLIAAQQAGVIKSGEKIKKDKRSEKDANILPQHATHLTEAVDILMWGMNRGKIGADSSFIDNMYTS